MKNRNKINIYLLLFPPLIAAALVFYISWLREPYPLQEMAWNLPMSIEKLIHFSMYFGLSIVIGMTYILLKKGKIIFLRLLFFAFLLPVAYGTVIEILQERYLDKSYEWHDFLTNSIGALIGFFSAIFIRNYIVRRNRKKQFQALG